jgi:hypothetical protein
MRTFLAIFLLLSLVACGSNGPKPIPYWGGKLFVGDSKRVGLSRAQSNEFVPADSKEFDEYIAMSASDFRSFYATYVLGCESWGDNAKLSLRPYKNNREAVTKILSKE